MHINSTTTAYTAGTADPAQTSAAGKTGKSPDFSQLLQQNIRSDSSPDEQKLKESCRQLESYLTLQLLESMYKTIPESDLLPASPGKDIWRSMLNEQYAQEISQSGTLGLSDLMYQQLSQNLPATGSEKGTDELQTVKLSQIKTRLTRNKTSASNGSISPEPSRASLQNLIDRTAGKYGLSSRLLSAVVEAESDYDPTCQSPAGAAGLMQLMPATARSLGVTDVWDPAQNLDGGARYLSQMLQRYGGDLKLALAAYNAGPGSVDRYKGVPPFAETQNYVNRILKSLSN